MSDQGHEFRAGGKSLSAYVHRVTSAIGVQMSPAGRRAATSVAASKGRQWVNRTLEDRPTRGEIRAWFGMVLDERRDLHNRVEALTKENEALRAQRDEALEGYREDVERFRAHVETLDADRTRRTKERDTAERNLHERTVEMTKAYEELRVAYDQAEAERNELARKCASLHGEVDGLRQRHGYGRASCSHTSRGGAE